MSGPEGGHLNPVKQDPVQRIIRVHWAGGADIMVVSVDFRFNVHIDTHTSIPDPIPAIEPVKLYFLDTDLCEQLEGLKGTSPNQYIEMTAAIAGGFFPTVDGAEIGVRSYTNGDWESTGWGASNQIRVYPKSLDSVDPPLSPHPTELDVSSNEFSSKVLNELVAWNSWNPTADCSTSGSTTWVFTPGLWASYIDTFTDLVWTGGFDDSPPPAWQLYTVASDGVVTGTGVFERKKTYTHSGVFQVRSIQYLNVAQPSNPGGAAGVWTINEDASTRAPNAITQNATVFFNLKKIKALLQASSHDTFNIKIVCPHMTQGPSPDINGGGASVYVHAFHDLKKFPIAADYNAAGYTQPGFIGQTYPGALGWDTGKQTSWNTDSLTTDGSPEEVVFIIDMTKSAPDIDGDLPATNSDNQNWQWLINDDLFGPGFYGIKYEGY